MDDCCPTCGRKFAARRVTVPASVDTSTMSDKELFAYYKQTAPAADLRFFLGLNLSPELRARAEGISKPTAKDIQVLREAWRGERNALDRALGRWHLDPFMPKDPEQTETTEADQ
jgi:hypothetical protein